MQVNEMFLMQDIGFFFIGSSDGDFNVRWVNIKQCKNTNQHQLVGGCIGI